MGSEHELEPRYESRCWLGGAQLDELLAKRLPDQAKLSHPSSSIADALAAYFAFAPLLHWRHKRYWKKAKHEPIAIWGFQLNQSTPNGHWCCEIACNPGGDFTSHAVGEGEYPAVAIARALAIATERKRYRANDNAD